MMKQTKIFLPILAVFCMTCTPSNNHAGRFHLPSKADTTNAAYVSGELIYPLDNRPTPECHASPIVETSDGLVTAFFAGTPENNPDLGIRVLRLVDVECDRNSVVSGRVCTVRFDIGCSWIFKKK